MARQRQVRPPEVSSCGDDGELFGVYGRNAQAAMSAAPLVLKLTSDNPLRGVDFFEGDDGALLLGG